MASPRFTSKAKIFGRVRWTVMVSLWVCACGQEASGDPARTNPGPASGAAAPGMTPGKATAGSGLGAIDNPGVAGSGAITPVAPIAPQPGGSCKAGHYLGTFTGDYRSGAWFDGAEPIVFATSDVGDKPGFEFWLESVDVDCPSGLEFCPEAIVKGGKLRGNVIPFADPNDPSTQAGAGFSVRFEIDLTGELDCRTGKFKGKLENGCYDILSLLYRFSGTIDGDYSVTTNEFSKGVWRAEEMRAAGATATTPLGGDGTWSAKHSDDSAPPSGASTGLCSGESGFDTGL